jgi:hypothetical protein
MVLCYGVYNMESGTLDVGSAIQANFSRNDKFDCKVSYSSFGGAMVEFCKNWC